MNICCVLLCLSLVLELSNGKDLSDWQKELWKSDPTILFLWTHSAGPSAGVYSYSGEHARASPPTNGFHEPLEFYWRTANKFNTGPEDRYDGLVGTFTDYLNFKVNKLGPDRYVLLPNVKGLKQSIATVRQLEDRWVAMMRMDGIPVVIHYWFVKFKTFAGIPTSMETITMHGYPIVNCTIDYLHEMKITFKEGDPWELISGEDPACACEPTPTCRERGESGTPCHAVVDPLFSQTLLGSDRYKQYVQQIPSKFGYSKGYYDTFLLINDTCSKLPHLLHGDAPQRLIKSCLDIFVQRFSSFGYFFLRSRGVRGSETRINSKDLDRNEAIALIEAPRNELLQCMETQGYILSLLEGQENSINDFEQMQNKLHSQLVAVMGGHDEVPDQSLSPQVMSALVFCTVVSIGSMLCCSCFSCCWLRKVLCGSPTYQSQNQPSGLEMQLTDFGSASTTNPARDL